METEYENVLRFESQGRYIEALEIISEAERCGNHSERLNILQAEIFMSLAEESENLYKKLVFLMAAVEAYSRNDACECVYPLFEISELLGSASFYSRVLKTAELFLKRIDTALGSQEPDVAKDGVYAHLLEEGEKVRSLVNVVNARIANQKENGAMVERLRPHWESSSENTKREFMKVSTQELRRFVLNKFEKEGRDALEKVLGHVKKNERWIFWLCRSCSQKFSTSEECTSHLEQVHAAEFAPSSMNDLVEKEVWSDKIAVGVWKDAIDLLCSSVESFCCQGLTGVKEKINFDSDMAYVLLDKRLLQGNVDERVDEGGKISFSDAKLHCTRVHAGGGDDFMSWLALSEDWKFKFPRPIREFNLDMWIASLKSYQFLCRTLQTHKVIHLDAEILLIDKSRVKLLKHLTGMCLFDFRCYLNPPLKEYIIDCLRRRFA